MPHRPAESGERSADRLVVFDRRGVEFLPPFQLALQTAKLLDTVVVQGAVPWRSLRRLTFRTRVERGPTRPDAAGRPTLYTPMLLPERGGLTRLTGPLNRLRLRRELGSLTGTGGRLALLYDNCAQLPLVGTLGEAVSAYYLYDDFRVDLTGRPHGGLDEAREARMLAAVDVVFAVSQKLCDYAAPHARCVHYLPNGFNADLFRPRPRPAGAADRGPVVGYSGVISGRVDLVGLYATAIARPEWTFRLLGEVIPSIERELEQTGRPGDLLRRLLALPNVEHLPPRPLADVPAVLADFDVGLVPYCLNRFTVASSPLKAYEYYAMGIPVVSTRIPEVIRFDPGVTTVAEGDSYAAAIALALDAGRDAGCRARQVAIAEPHSTLVRARDAVSRLFPHGCG